MTGKYPASIIEAVARAIYESQCARAGFELRWDVLDEWAREAFADDAVAALDALPNLTVYEQFGVFGNDGWESIYKTHASAVEHAAVPASDRIARRTALHAETDWEVVSDGTE